MWLWSGGYGQVVMIMWLWSDDYGQVVMIRWLWSGGYVCMYVCMYVFMYVCMYVHLLTKLGTICLEGGDSIDSTKYIYTTGISYMLWDFIPQFHS